MGTALLLKEIRNHLLSFRFLVVSVLLLVLVPTTVFVLGTDAVRKQEDFSRRQADIQAYLGEYAHFNRLNSVIAPSQPPIPFLALVRGLSADVNAGQFDNDPLPVLFPLIDLAFIVSILLSLAALILSYDGVSGEREDGTLKLMLSNGVSRASVLLNKLLGTAVSLLLPFLLSLGLGVLLILLNPRLGWSGADWAALGLILAGAVLYLLVFIGLGLLVSSRHTSSASAIMTSLFIWVLAALVVPNLSPYAASLLRPTPSRIQIGREVDRLTDVERDNLGRELSGRARAETVREHPLLAGIEKMSETDIKSAVASDPAFAAAYKVLRDRSEAAWREANDIQGRKAQVLRSELSRKEGAQTRLALGLSMASPLAAFTYLAADLSGTGEGSARHFSRLASTWSRAYGEYMQAKMQAMREADPTRDVWNTVVDVGDMPRFSFRPEPLADRFKRALPSFAVLAAAGILLFLAAFLSFARADVR